MERDVIEGIHKHKYIKGEEPAGIADSIQNIGTKLYNLGDACFGVPQGNKGPQLPIRASTKELVKGVAACVDTTTTMIPEIGKKTVRMVDTIFELVPEVGKAFKDGQLSPEEVTSMQTKLNQIKDILGQIGHMFKR